MQTINAIHSHWIAGFASLFELCKITADEQVMRYLCLSRGVASFLLPFSEEPESIVSNALAQLKERGFVGEGDSVIILSDVLGEEFAQDSIHLKRIE